MPSGNALKKSKEINLKKNSVDRLEYLKLLQQCYMRISADHPSIFFLGGGGEISTNRKKYQIHFLNVLDINKIGN